MIEDVRFWIRCHSQNKQLFLLIMGGILMAMAGFCYEEKFEPPYKLSQANFFVEMRKRYILCSVYLLNNLIFQDI